MPPEGLKPFLCSGKIGGFRQGKETRYQSESSLTFSFSDRQPCDLVQIILVGLRERFRKCRLVGKISDVSFGGKLNPVLYSKPKKGGFGNSPTLNRIRDLTTGVNGWHQTLERPDDPFNNALSDIHSVRHIIFNDQRDLVCHHHNIPHLLTEFRHFLKMSPNFSTIDSD